MAIEYDEIQLKISSVLDSTKGLDKAVDRLDETKSALDGLAKVDISNTTKEVEEFAQAIDSVKPTSLDLAKKAADKYRHAWHNGRSPQKGRTVELEGNTASSASAMFGDASDEIGKATKSLQYYKDMVEEIKKSSQNTSAFKKVGETIRNAFEKAKESVSSVFSSLSGIVNRFGRLITYRIMRSIISGFVNGLKEGFKNLEDWDRSMGNTGFAQQMDRARESLLAIKNALAVATAPLLEYIIGMLQRVAQWAIEAANWISRMVAILGGKSSYRVVKWANTVAKSEAKAGGSAKKATEEFKKQLMAFDEINNLSAPGESGSGGGGGSGGAADYTDMFDVETLGDLSNFEKKVKQVFEAIKKGYAETMSSLKAKSDEFKLMWKNFFTDHDTWREDWKKKWDVALTVWANNIAHVSKAIYLTLKGDFEGAWNEIMAIFNDGNKEMQVAIQKYGYNWAVQHGYVRNYFTDTYSKYVHPVTLKTIEHSKEAATSITDSYDKASRGVKTAFGKIEAGSKTSRSVVIDDLTAIGKKATDITKNPYTVTVDVRENLTRYVSILETRVPTTQASALRGYGYGFAANGGFFKEGQAFIAREAGPELVGTIGGHTAVANNDQIVTAVSQGVASAVSSVLGNQGSNVTVTLEGDAKGLFKVVQKEGRAYSARTGQPALA